MCTHTHNYSTVTTVPRLVAELWLMHNCPGSRLSHVWLQSWFTTVPRLVAELCLMGCQASFPALLLRCGADRVSCVQSGLRYKTGAEATAWCASLFSSATIPTDPRHLRRVFAIWLAELARSRRLHRRSERPTTCRRGSVHRGRHFARLDRPRGRQGGRRGALGLLHAMPRE